VSEVKPDSIVLNTGDELEYGICIFSIGNTQLDFVKRLDVEKGVGGKISVKDSLQLVDHPDV